LGEATDKAAPHGEYSSAFQFGRVPQTHSTHDAELLLLRLEHSAYCGSGGRISPVLRFLRIGSVP
jgi:hypothetical protein